MWVADLLSGLGLVAVVIIGWLTVRLGRRSTVASERSAEATLRSVKASKSAAIATQRSIAVSELAARLADQDARCRRLEGALDVVLAMRELFNEQNEQNETLGTGEPSYWAVDMRSVEGLKRLALRRKLEGRVVTFEDDLDQNSCTRTLATTTAAMWSSSNFEGAITELRRLLKEASRASPEASVGPCS